MRRRAEQACINCHFLAKNPAGGPFVVRAEERESIRKQDYSPFEHCPLACHLGVWDEGSDFDTDRKHEVIVETNRQGFCFFWEYRPGMLFPAAETLQKREADNREASLDRKRTIRGLRIAAAALVLDFLVDVDVLPKALDLLRCVLSKALGLLRSMLP